MKCFHIDCNELPKILLLGREALIPPRTHLSRRLTEYVLYIITKGKMTLKVNGLPLTLTAGDIYLFSKDDWQLPAESAFCEYYYVHLLHERIREHEMSEKEYVNALTRKQLGYMRTDAFNPKCYDFMEVLIREKVHISDEVLFERIIGVLQSNILSAEYKEPKKRYALSTTIASLLFELEAYGIPQADAAKVKLEKAYDTAGRIASYIEQHYAEAITGEMIEQQFYISFDHANRVFRKVMGCTIIKYRNIVRIQHAKARLRAANSSIQEIALELDFDNIHYFSRVFRQHEGLSPSDYKRKFMKINEQE